MKVEEKLPCLHIVVLGAGGGIGRACVTTALAAGHRVTAILRTLSKLEIIHPNLQIVKGDVSDPGSFSAYLEGKDAVISAIGVNGGFGKDKPTTLYSEGNRNVLNEMVKTGVDRAFFISASALEVSPVVPFFIRLLIKYVVQKLLKHMYEDLRRMEAIIKKSDINWTIIRPPQLTDKPATTKYRVAINAFLKNGLKLSRQDLAHFMIHHITHQKTYRSTVEIAY
ncbi:Putative NADH-flavin reductase [Chitinophaga costaii]|uniref:Putative NADH-flavin reductase n=1 Tax=Chitinophaga costaii TaxID=1335309 RepID=A0A1C4BC91_9BACT|nr:NAD(P)H-binding protein [Chitinophaga costaii]PUZ27667.1 epimerase [Chitinophaga costaii]SCC04469.1 Putative NADH-flavin reductase [Chitinophaga costaii]